MARTEQHITRSHLLRRLLQRRVDLLEREKHELRAQVELLETRLQQAAAATNERTPEQTVRLDEAVAHVHAIGTRTQKATQETLRTVRGAQSQLGSEMSTLLQECQALRMVVIEAAEGVNAILERTQSRVVDIVKESHAEEERLGEEIERFLQQQGPAALTESVGALQDHAQKIAARLETEAAAERQQRLSEIQALRAQSSRLSQALRTATEVARTISAHTQAEAEKIVGDSAPHEPPPQEADGAEVDFPDDFFLLDEALLGEEEAANLLSHPLPTLLREGAGGEPAPVNGRHPQPNSASEEERLLRHARKNLRPPQPAPAALPEPEDDWTGPLLLSMIGAQQRSTTEHAAPQDRPTTAPPPQRGRHPEPSPSPAPPQKGRLASLQPWRREITLAMVLFLIGLAFFMVIVVL